MTKDRYTLAGLEKMSHKQLVAVGAELGLKLTKNDNKLECRKRIMAEYARGDVGRAADAGKGERLPENPEFEELVSEPSEPAAEPERRGGARTGAGRPLGMTESKARMNNLPQQPNPAIQFAIVGLFDAWAAAARVPEIALTQDEAFRLALPYSQLAYYFGWDRYLPDWLQLVIVATWNTYDIAKVKLAIIRAANPKRHNVRVCEDEVGTWTEPLDEAEV